MIIIIKMMLIFLVTPAVAQTAEFVWSEDSLNGSKILLSEYENGQWQPAENVVEDSNWNILPTLGSSSKNQKLAVWTMLEGDKSSLKYSIKKAGKWTAPRLLTDVLQTNLAPVVVFDNRDVCWVFWSANNGDDDDDIYMSRFSKGNWSAPEQVNAPNDVPDILPEAGLDEAGNVWVSWQSLSDEGYVDVTRSFEQSSQRGLSPAQAMNMSKIKQLKSRSNSTHGMQPPESFNSLGRASFHFPGDKQRPSKTVQGNRQQ